MTLLFPDLSHLQTAWSRQSSSDLADWMNRVQEQVLGARHALLSALESDTCWLAQDLDLEWQRVLALLEVLQWRVGQPQFGRPLGRVGLITSAVAPLSGPLEALLTALVSGNLVTWKPSERSRLLPEILHQTLAATLSQELPWALAAGDRELGRKLALSREHDAIWMIGSFETGIRVQQDTLAQHAKTLSLALGSRNIGWISRAAWEATPDRVADQVVQSSLGFAGQDCRCLHRLIVEDSILPQVTERIRDRMAAHPLSPMIDLGYLDRVLKFLGVGAKEGIDWSLRGSTQNGLHLGPSLGIIRRARLQDIQKSSMLQSDFMAPLLVVYSLADSESLTAHLDASSYGLLSARWITPAEGLGSTPAAELPEPRKVDEICENQTTLVRDYARIRVGLKRSGNSTFLGCADPRWGRI